MQFDEPPQSMVQFDGNVPGILHEHIWYVGEGHGIVGELSPANAEKDIGSRKDLKQQTTIN